MARKAKNFKFYDRLIRSRKPGQSLADLARANGISPKLLYTYRSYRKNTGKDLDSFAAEPESVHSPFLPVLLKQATGPVIQKSGFELAIEGLGILRIPADFEAPALQRLLATLSQLPC